MPEGLRWLLPPPLPPRALGVCPALVPELLLVFVLADAVVSPAFGVVTLSRGSPFLATMYRCSDPDGNNLKPIGFNIFNATVLDVAE